MAYTNSIADAIREHISVPPHIVTAAGMCAHDLMHGPTFAIIPPAGIEAIDPDLQAAYAADLEGEEGDLTEVYCGPVGEALRAFLADLPPTLYVDEDCGGVSEREPEPEGYWTDAEGEECEADAEGAEWCAYDIGGIWEVDSASIVEALFGKTIARHFS